MIRKLMVSLCLLLPQMGSANLNKDLNQFFNQFGVSANVNAGDIYQGQKAGYMTGGSISVRNRVQSQKLATVNLPRFDAGCGGIDIFAGGFSFISRDELIQNLKNTASNAAGYAFLLGLETMSPQVSNTIKQLQSWSNSINSININSCETASDIVGAVWPRKSLANQQICRSTAGRNGLITDYVSGRHKCSYQAGFDEAMQGIGKDKGFQDVLGEEYNIAWEAIQKQKVVAANPMLAELFMSLMGTVIVQKKEQFQIETWPSKISDELFLQTLMEGGRASVYHCKDSKDKKCLNLVSIDLEIRSDQGWLGKIKEMLLNIQNRILNDEELAEPEKELLAKSRLPLYKIVNVMTAYKKGYCPVDLYQIAEVVAQDLLVQALREAVELVRQGAHQLKRGQMYADEIDSYLEDLKRVEKAVHYYEARTNSYFEREFQMMQKIQMIEEQIASEITIN
jgi:conjugative transfer pilus assembly protein TraH